MSCRASGTEPPASAGRAPGGSVADPRASTRASSETGVPSFVRARVRAWCVLGAALAGVWLSITLGGGSSGWFVVGAVLAGAGSVIGGLSGPRAARWWWVGALGSVVCVAGGWGAARFREPAPDRLDRLVADGSIVAVRGVVASDPLRRERPSGPAAPGYWRGDSVWFALRITGVVGADGERPASGVTRVFGGVDLLGRVSAGQTAELTGVFAGPSRARNPGEPDWTRLGNERGRAGSVSVGGGGTVVVTGDAPGGVWSRLVAWRGAMRARAMAALGLGGHDGEADGDTGVGDGGGGGVVGALVLGERDASFEGVYRSFQRAGVAHVLAVSGFHLALLCGLAALGVRLTGERGRLETAAVVLVVVVLLVFVPARSPIVRAGVLALALVLGDALGRRWDRLALLAWAGVGLLVWRPSEAVSLGYLLSVGVTGLLIALAERDRRDRWWLLTRGVRTGPVRRAGRWVWAALRLNTACWAASTPLIVASTGVFSPLAPVATLALVPVAGLLLVVGWMQAVLGVVWPGGADATRWAVEDLGRFTGAAAGWFDGLPGSSVLVVGVGWFWAAFVTAGVLGWLFWKRRRAVFVALIALGAAYAGAVSAVAGRVDGLRADMLDVGDGTSVLIRSGGSVVLWDCGSLQREVGDRVADAAVALGVRRIDAAFVSHPNLDHFNALPVIADRMGLRRVFVPPVMAGPIGAGGRLGGWSLVRAELESMGVEIVGVSIGDTIGGSDGLPAATVLWPPREVAPRWAGNDGSLVVRFAVATDAGERSVLMTGDIQRAGIAGLEAAGADTTATVIEVPHHGSADPAAMLLVERSGAAVAVQSTGASRLNDDRWARVRSQRRWLCTAEDGAVWAWIRGRGVVETGGMRD